MHKVEPAISSHYKQKVCHSPTLRLSQVVYFQLCLLAPEHSATSIRPHRTGRLEVSVSKASQMCSILFLFMKLARLLIFYTSTIHINSMTKCVFISTVWLFAYSSFLTVWLLKCLDGRAARPAFQDFRVKFRKYEVHRRSSTRWQIDLGQSFFFQSLTHYMMRDLLMNKTSKNNYLSWPRKEKNRLDWPEINFISQCWLCVCRKKKI